ncbi:glycosyltransferase family 4 protein [Egbenema bharatensis]|uniref:glycosyltransferase family 4 protein n=1 Tax=Egbenema bharatensis TaxID=3463334 RepID=UPI003A8ADF07
MKIAFISYEFPPDTAYGGIATYVDQSSRLLRQRGHHVEVFTSSPYQDGTQTQDGIIIHRAQEKSREAFPKLIGPIFAERHQTVKFDVVEGPDYCADAMEAVRLCPDIPLAIRFHSPRFLIDELNNAEPSFLQKLRVYLGALRRGQKPIRHWQYNLNEDIERIHALDADELVVPSSAMAEKVIVPWGLDPEKVSQIANPCIPSEALLKIPVDTCTQVVTFVGRLEVRKGVIDLARAIPQILKVYPQAKFRFVGRSWNSPRPQLNMQQYLEQMLKPYLNSVEFTGHIASDKLPEIFTETDICVFPSLWEPFGLVCTEAMAAARGVVASNAGGMAELLAQGEVGRLVPPQAPQAIAESIIELLKYPTLRMHLGKSARARVLAEYSAERIGQLQEDSYIRAIQRRKSLGLRY